jgi:hypothetical protein
MRDEVDRLLAVRLREDDLFLVAEGRPFDQLSALVDE